MLDKYRDYFDIDPEYFPQINEKVINNNPDIWKKFYPHETFVKLLKDTVSVISRKQKVSICVWDWAYTYRSQWNIPASILVFPCRRESPE